MLGFVNVAAGHSESYGVGYGAVVIPERFSSSRISRQKTGPSTRERRAAQSPEGM